MSTHFMTNLLTRVPRSAQPWVATMVRTIYQQPSPQEVHSQREGGRAASRALPPGLLDAGRRRSRRAGVHRLAHWKQVWSNNPQERLRSGDGQMWWASSFGSVRYSVGRRYRCDHEEALQEAPLTQSPSLSSTIRMTYTTSGDFSFCRQNPCEP